MSKHDRFILTPITTEIEKAIYATRSIDIGIETYPLNEYMLQSLFLRMTGFQEQKMKCIAWEMGTDDFDFRRELLGTQLKLGEYSTYDSKNTIYKNLLTIIKKNNASFSLSNIDKDSLQKHSVDAIINLFENSAFSTWNQRKYSYFKKEGKNIINTTQLLSNTEKHILENDLRKKYTDDLYRQRNRLAHNILSYQENLPSLIELKVENNEVRNYFLYFAILVLIDNIFMELYKEFRKAIDGQYYY